MRVVVECPGNDLRLCPRCVANDAARPASDPALTTEVLQHVADIQATGSIQRPTPQRKRGL